MGSRLGQVQVKDLVGDLVEDRAEDRVEDQVKDQVRDQHLALKTHRIYNLLLHYQSFYRRIFCSHREL